MLSALLSSIQSKLGSQGFLVGAVFPVLIFLMINAALAYRALGLDWSAVTRIDSVADKALAVTMVAGAITVVSFVLSSLSTVLLETWEGKHWPVSWLAPLLHWMQRERLRRLEEQYYSCVVGLGDIQDGLDGDPAASPPVVGWIQALEAAKARGHATERAIPEMTQVRWRRKLGFEISPDALQQAVTKLVVAGQTRHIDRDCGDLIEAIRFARDRYQAERIRLFKRRRFEYPVDLKTEGDTKSAIILAPTSMGNIGRTMRAYAQRQYELDLDVLWTRLQNASQSSDKFYQTLQDARVQLDFYVACMTFACVTVGVWMTLELAMFHSRTDYLAISLGGTVLFLLTRWFAGRAYLVFADVMRTCVDLFRFKLMSDLHLPLPAGIEEEKVMWVNLVNVMGYENSRSDQGSPISFTYKH